MMTPPTITGTNSTTCGFGLFMGKLGALKLVQHGGADVSHRSQFLYFPEIDAGLTVQSNFSGFDGSVANRIARAFFASEIGTTSRPVAGAMTPRPSSRNRSTCLRVVMQWTLTRVWS
jgi:hypothetical protein